MIPGFGGQLISEAFLETQCPPAADHAAVDCLRRDLAIWRARSGELGPTSSLRSMLETGAAPLVAQLGFHSIVAIDADEVTIEATMAAGARGVALTVAGWGAALDRLWRVAVAQAIRRNADWAVLFNGVQLRLLDARQPFAHRHTDFDLNTAIDNPGALAALWTVMCAARFTGEDSTSSVAGLVAASDAHAAGVCRSHRDGVLSASTDVFGALAGRTSRRRPAAVGDTFEQALTIVYRLLFLLFAEARSLLPVWHSIYRDSYSLESLRARLETSPGGRQGASGPGSSATGSWDTLRAIARLAHAGCRAGDLHVTPFNGRLFAPARTPLADRGDLDDEAAKRAVLALATRPVAGGTGRERIAYRDLGVEQLGAVYQTLLDYEPQIMETPVSEIQISETQRSGTALSKSGIVDSGRRSRSRRRPPPLVRLVPGSGVRKTTGTFYTPQAIAAHLVRQTLAPLVRGKTHDEILQLRVADPAMGSGAFLVAACQYLAAAYEAALVDGEGCRPADIGEHERVLIRRTIAERCLYGVDVNPMAVQLARLSMWLTTLAADRPLSFLDHRLQVGDSLLGAALSNLRQAPKPGSRSNRQRPDTGTLPLFDLDAARDALRDTVPLRFSLEAVPNDTLDQVHAKERVLAAIAARDGSLSKWRQVADLWCASWLSTPAHLVPPEAFVALADRILTGKSALPAAAAKRYLDAAEDVSRARRLFHWELEFPEVFFSADGRRRDRPGFDAIVGNPPWEMMRADTGSLDTRTSARAAMEPILRFTRDAGLYRAQSTGHPNRYQLFVERAVSLTRAGGRLGLVLPSGLATDGGSAALRSMLLTQCDVDAIVGFDNRRAVFPIHRSVSFLLVTATAGSPTKSIACRLGLEIPVALQSLGDNPAAAASSYPVRLSPALLRRLSGDDLVIPLLRTSLDVAIAERAAASFPPLGSTQGWGARFGRELNATDDRAAFRSKHGEPAAHQHRDRRHPGRGHRDLGRRDLPIVEGKLLEPFRVRLDRAHQTIFERDARRLLADRRFDRPRLAYRDVASATNRLTLIAAVLPGGCVSTHTVFCLRTPLASRDRYFLCGLFNSFVVNYFVRSRVTTHVTTATVERLPIPTPGHAPGAHRDIAGLARLLARRFDDGAYASLQARVGQLYQLSAAEFEHVLSTFPLIPETHRDAALTAFKELAGIRPHRAPTSA